MAAASCCAHPSILWSPPLGIEGGHWQPARVRGESLNAVFSSLPRSQRPVSPRSQRPVSPRCTQLPSKHLERFEGRLAHILVEQKCRTEGLNGTRFMLDTSFDTPKTMVAAGLLMCLALSFQVVDPACAFTLFGSPAEEKDPVEPFTLYGSVFKKYLIEEIVDGKVVGRKKGFTASACVNALDASKETPEVAGLPAGLKVTLPGDPSCAKGVAQSREESCQPPCKSACSAAVARHVKEVKDATGYIFDATDAAKAMDACASQCFNEYCKEQL